MLLTNFYTIKQIQPSSESNTWKVQIELNPEHPVYAGHFPGHPVVPGVCLLQIIKESVESIRQVSLQYAQVGSCKFLSVVNPLQTPDLHFTLMLKEEEEGKQKLLAEGTANEELFIKLKAVLQIKSPAPMKASPGTVVIIPTYNNGKTLSTVIEDVWCYVSHIIVVNDGSTDNTATILESKKSGLSSKSSLHVITHPVNQGKGTALQNGLSYAKAQGYRYAITIDSDGQHFASDIPFFIEAIEQEPDALLIGARNLASDNMPGKNTFANKFSNFWFTLETGIKLQDTQSGYRLYPLQKMNVRKWYYTAKYEFELEAIVFAAWSGITVKNIPVHVYYPPQEERVSHFRPFQDFSRISVLNTVLVLITFLWIVPRNFFRRFTWKNCKRFFSEQVIHSKESNLKITGAIMLGIFMGIVPIWGYQMLVTLFLAHLLKLNKVIAIVAANISIPPIIPFLLYGSYLTGCKVMEQPASLHLNDLSLENVKSVLGQYLVGSVIFAAVCSIAVGIISISVLSLCRRKTT